MPGGNPLLRDLTKSGAGGAQPYGAQYGQASHGPRYQQPGYNQGYGQPGYGQGYGRPHNAAYSAEPLDALYNAPAAGTNQTGRMTYDDAPPRCWAPLSSAPSQGGSCRSSPCRAP
jgi:hypothetical protein